MSKEIPLTQGLASLVDDDDYEGLMQHKWYATKMKGGAKAKRSLPRDEDGRQESAYMHRVIMNAKKGQYVDHRNHDTLDNRRANLRLCTQSQNMGNRRKSAGSMYRFKGVRKNNGGGAWRAQICVEYIRTELGTFANERDAARSYNAAAIEHFGEFALLNEV